VKKILIGVMVSLVFLYFSFRGADWEGVLLALRGLRYGFLIPAVLLIVSGVWIRSLRWGVILSPLESVSQKKLFPITCIGFMAIALIPMRIGEMARPYLVSRESSVSFSPAMASIFVERVIDSFSILVILFIVVMGMSLPGWVIKAGYGFFTFFLTILTVACFLYFSKGFHLTLMAPILRRLPARTREKAEGMVKSFGDGLGILGSFGRLTYTLFLSFLMWGMAGVTIYCMFGLFHLDLPLQGAFVVLLITMIGISLPAAPGLIGNFQFACIVALSLFGVPKDNALAFSMIYYFICMGIQVGLGLLFLPSVKVSWSEFKKGLL
jgi:uncharacterized protein (TIRG00374 family)